MTYVYCNCRDCVNNEDGVCQLEEISIKQTLSAVYPAKCDDFFDKDEQDG